jgi:hypothetical protein
MALSGDHAVTARPASKARRGCRAGVGPVWGCRARPDCAARSARRPGTGGSPVRAVVLCRCPLVDACPGTACRKNATQPIRTSSVIRMNSGFICPLNRPEISSVTSVDSATVPPVGHSCGKRRAEAPFRRGPEGPRHQQGSPAPVPHAGAGACPALPCRTRRPDAAGRTPQARHGRARHGGPDTAGQTRRARRGGAGEGARSGCPRMAR